jgi:hypothetical protein
MPIDYDGENCCQKPLGIDEKRHSTQKARVLKRLNSSAKDFHYHREYRGLLA